MLRSHIAARMHKVATAVLGLLLSCLCAAVLIGFSLEAMSARHEGMTVGQAAARAIHKLLSGLLPTLGVVVAAAVFGLMVAVVVGLIVARPVSDKADSPVQAGTENWLQTRRRLTLLQAPIMLILAAVAAYKLIKGDYEGFLFFLFGFVINGIVLLVNWTRRPSREMLYAVGSGDVSRLNDERAVMLREKASMTALNAFPAVFIPIGVVYETLVCGNWPFLTGFTLLWLWSVFAISTAYWNRRL